jgi:nucleotide-binding universal stress UspA family protein
MAARSRRIVVGYDGSESSRRALDAAADLVGYGSTLSVVTVRNGEPAAEVVKEARARLHARHVEAQYHETAGEWDEQLLEKASELGADLVVVGQRDRNLVGRARCDVLVVR